MSFANRRRVKEMLELTFPGFIDRNDKDSRVDRLLSSAHSHVRFEISKAGGTIPVFLELAAFTPLIATVPIVALTNEDRRIRFRLKDAAGFGTSPVVIRVTGEVDGIQTTEDVELDENGEFVTNTAWKSIELEVTVTNIPSTPGEIQVLESVDPELEQIEEWKAACLYLLESGDRFSKEAEAPEKEDFCDMAKAALKAWIREAFKVDETDYPLYMRASS